MSAEVRKNAMVSRRIRDWESGILFTPAQQQDQQNQAAASNKLTPSKLSKETLEPFEVKPTNNVHQPLRRRRPVHQENAPSPTMNCGETVGNAATSDSSSEKDTHLTENFKELNMSGYQQVPAGEDNADSVTLDRIIKAINVDDATPEERENLAKIINALKQQQKLEETGEIPRSSNKDGVVIPDYVALPVLAAMFILLFALMMGKVWYQMNQVKKLQGNQ
eukprot:TRINITY_DN23642_c0_g1_i1.p1 TRINITY_DN23642_c0_g1~~TRINITY_DN23642_c0_g1_i1.p1  ORF type:complete len:249 (-),score=50.99 TRINITY_DN23642_c0_g1_i1:178-840(-)